MVSECMNRRMGEENGESFRVQALGDSKETILTLLRKRDCVFIRQPKPKQVVSLVSLE